jgi:hypothetical protein
MTTTKERKDEPATVVTVWAALMENRQQQAETDRELKETARMIKEMSREAERREKKLDRRMKATDKRVGELSNRFGDMVESMVIPNLVAKFAALGYVFLEAGEKEIKDPEHGIYLQIDAYLENDECALAVETKVKPNEDDVDNHIKRLEKLRRYADFHAIKRPYYGGIAGAVMSREVKAYTLAHGLFAIEPSGETFIITPPEGPGAPRKW